MKRFLSLTLALAVAASAAVLSSCDGDTSTTSSTNSANSQPGTVSINSIIPSDPLVQPDKDAYDALFRTYEEVDLEAFKEDKVNLMTDYYDSWVESVSIFTGYEYSPDDPEFGDLGSENAPNIFDGNTATKWCGNPADAEFASAVVWKMKEAVNVTGYSITTGNDNAEYKERNLIRFRLYACNELPETRMDAKDETTGLTYFRSYTVPEGWTLIDAVDAADPDHSNSSVLPDENFLEIGFALPEAGEYQYFMLLIDDNENNAIQMSEFTLYGTVAE